MKVLRKILYIVMCACSLVLQAQVTYQWDAIEMGLGGIVRYELREIDFLNSTEVRLIRTFDPNEFTHPNMTGFDNIILSFDFSPDRQSIYFLEREGDLWRYSIDHDTLEYLIDLTPEVVPFPLIHGYTLSMDMLFVNDSIIYIAGQNHATYNINTGVVTRLRQPINHPISFTLPENEIAVTRFVRHKGRYLYLPGPKSKTIRILDLEDPENHQLLFDYSFLSSGIGINSKPLVSYSYGCDSTILYSYLRLSPGIGSVMAWYRIDNTTGQMTYSHPYLPIPNQNAYNCVRHYNAVEYEDCQRRVNLDSDDSTIEGINFLLDSLCRYDGLPISDIDISISNEFPIDSLVIVILDSRPTDSIIFNPIQNAIRRLSHDTIHIINDGALSNTSIENIVRLARIDIAESDVSEVRIQFTAWYNGVAGTPATATLKWHTPLPYAGPPIMWDTCEEQEALDLFPILDVSTDKNGVFIDSSTQVILTTVDLSSAATFDLLYIATNGVCFDTSQVQINISPNPTIEALRDFHLCPNDSQWIQIITDDSVEWFDGSTNKNRPIAEAGTYQYTITNSFGCSARDTFNVTTSPVATLSSETQSLCEGDTLIYNGRVYTVSGVHSDTLQNIKGCDSIISYLTINLYNPDPLILSGDRGFCEGSYTIINLESEHTNLKINNNIASFPKKIDNAGIYKLVATDKNGCENELTLDIEAFALPDIETEDLINIVYSNPIDMPVMYEGDIQQYVWSPSLGLDCSDCPFPQLILAQEGIYSIEVEDINGCKSQNSIRVTFKNNELFLPNIIKTSSASKENSVFYAKGESNSTYSLSIYDRWGNLMFNNPAAKVNNIDDGWNPQNTVNSGVFVYIISYMDKGQAKVIQGDITVLE